MILVTLLKHLKVELSTSPVTALGVPVDGVTGSHADPLRNGAVLLLGLAENTLGLERLVGRL